MSVTKTLKPAKGIKVRRPDGRRLVDEGDDVTMSPYWVRRLADGDVVEVSAARSAAKKSAGDGRDKGNRE